MLGSEVVEVEVVLEQPLYDELTSPRDILATKGIYNK